MLQSETTQTASHAPDDELKSPNSVEELLENPTELLDRSRTSVESLESEDDEKSASCVESDDGELELLELTLREKLLELLDSELKLTDIELELENSSELLDDDNWSELLELENPSDELLELEESPSELSELLELEN